MMSKHSLLIVFLTHLYLSSILIAPVYAGIGDDLRSAATTVARDVRSATRTVVDDARSATRTVVDDARQAASLAKDKILEKYWSNKIVGSFEDIYPKPFFQTPTGKFVLIGGSAILVGAITYFTAGTGVGSAGPIATWVGTQVGMASGVGSGATAAGLAILGGGTVASGGLGIAGGLAVLGAVSDIGVMIALDQAADFIPEDRMMTEKYHLLRLPLPEKASPSVLEQFTKAETIITELKTMNPADPRYAEKAGMVRGHYRAALGQLQQVDPESATAGYDYIARAILEYNFMEYEKALQSISTAMKYTQNRAFCGYMISLIRLTQGDDESLHDAAILLDQVTEDDPSAIQPYLLQTIVRMDMGQPEIALRSALVGLEHVDDNFELNWRAAEIAFHNLKQYRKSALLYEAALENTTQNKMEAVCKMMIALSHHRHGNSERAIRWYQRSIHEISDLPNEVAKMNELWENLKKDVH